MKIFNKIQISEDGITFRETIILIYKNLSLLAALIISSILLFYYQVSDYQKNIMYGKFNSYVQGQINCSINLELSSIITDFNLNLPSMEFLKNIKNIDPCENISKIKSILGSEETYKAYDEDIISSKIVEINSFGNFYENKFLIKFQFKNENFLLVSEKQKEQQMLSVNNMLIDLVKKINFLVIKNISDTINNTEYLVNNDIFKNKILFEKVSEKLITDTENKIYEEQLFKTRYNILELEYYKDFLSDLKNKYLSLTKNKNNLVFQLDEEKIKHISLLRENNRLNLFQKMSALELSIYFSFFISFLFILLLVLVNSLLNNKIIND